MQDDAWEKFARSDPYWAVLTDPRFKTNSGEELTEADRASFFRSGQDHVTRVTSVLARHFDRRISGNDICLDFGSGVGRLLIPMARHCGRAIGIDVSATMRRICLENALQMKAANVECYPDVDHKALGETRFDWINSYIVFQHMNAALGYRVFESLLQRVKLNGVISIHFTVYKDARVANYLNDRMRYFAVDEGGVRDVYSGARFYPDDVMMMNDYDVTRLHMLLGQYGFRRVFTEHENQGGMHGLLFYAIREGEGPC